MAGAALLLAGVAAATPQLDATEVTRIIGNAATAARRAGLPVSIAVVDHEGNVLGTHSMPGAPALTILRGGGAARCQPPIPPADCGVEGLQVPPATPAPLDGALLAAISKAGTAAFLSTNGHAFTTRTAGFIIQPHFPPGVANTAGGPLFGVQLSQLPCGDVVPRSGVVYPAPLPALAAGTLPLGLAADPGGVPLYKNGVAVGGIGVEGNQVYGIDAGDSDRTPTREESIAVAGTRGYAAPRAIRATQIFVGGLRLPFTAGEAGAPAGPAGSYTATAVDVSPRDALPSRFVPAQLGAVRGTADPRYFPARDGVEPAPATNGLAAADVTRMLTRAARRAERLRAAIRRPLGDRARVTIAVVDAGGHVLGIFRTADAPVFGFDVAVQKARSAAFFSRPDTATLLRAADALRGSDILARFTTRAARDGLPLDGTTAFSNRAIGFLARPFFPDGIDANRPGPFSRPIDEFSVFNDGLQIELVFPALAAILTGGAPGDCTAGTVPGLGNGLQIFAGSVPLYRDARLVGAIGVSGDGIDQDDTIATAGAYGFRAPANLRTDRVQVRGVRLPFTKRPRRPDTR